MFNKDKTEDKTVASTFPWVAILILNWNRALDTIQCLRSVLHLDYSNFVVVVIDNGSDEHSPHEIQRWMEDASRSEGLYSRPPEILNINAIASRYSELAPDGNARLVSLIRCSTNRGYAAGNNVGIRACMNLPWIKYFWILNNDTVVEPSTLLELVLPLIKDQSIGIAGSLMVSYDLPGYVDSAGSRFLKSLCLSQKIYRRRSLDFALSKLADVEEVDCADGASMLISKGAIESIGVLAEQYFLYFEELDYAVRARDHGYRVVTCKASRVRHKVGTSTRAKVRQPFSARLRGDVIFQRSRISFIRSHYPYLVLLAPIGALVTVSARLGRLDLTGALATILAFGTAAFEQVTTKDI